MKVHYGTSLPPGLDAPTRGELKVVVERLALQDELIPRREGAPLIPVDHCSVGVVFWGEELPTTSFAPKVNCVPQTDAHLDRGVQCIIFPVKTLEAQFSQYCQHMANSPSRGMQLRVAVPPQYSGKKNYVPVGLAVVDLGGVTSSTSIKGWFQVVHWEQQTTCIGRIRLSISVHFFVDQQQQQRQQQSPQLGKQPLVSLPPQNQSMAASSSSTATAGDSGSTGDHATTAQQPKRTGTSALDNGTEHQSIVEPSVHGKADQQKSSLLASSPSEQQRVVQQQQQNKKEEATVANVQQHSPLLSISSTGNDLQEASSLEDKHRLRSWFQRGLNLRNQMFAATSATSSSAVVGVGGLRLSPPVRGSMVEAPPSNSLPFMPGRVVMAEAANLHIQRARHDHHLLDTTVSSFSSSSSSTTSTDSSDSDNDKNEGYKISRNDAGQPSSTMGPTSVVVGAAVSFHGKLTLRISHLSFFASSSSNNSLREIRFAARLSQDVACTNPSHASGAALSSLVHLLPFSDPEKVVLICTEIEGYTSASKVALECYHVVSKPAPPLDPFPTTSHADSTKRFLIEGIQEAAQEVPFARRVLDHETLQGIAILDLCPQSGRTVVFRDPLTGDQPIQCMLDVDLQPRSMFEVRSHAMLPPLGESTAEVKFSRDDYEAAAEHQKSLSKQAWEDNKTSNRKKVKSSHHQQTALTDSSREHVNESLDALSSDTESGMGSSGTSSASSSSPSVSSSDRRRSRRRHHRRTSPLLVVYNGVDVKGTKTVESTNDIMITVHHREPQQQQHQQSPLLAGGGDGLNNICVGGSDNKSPDVIKLHVTVQQARQLPQVVCSETAAISLLTLTTHDEDDIAGKKHKDNTSTHRQTTDPSTFVALEDFFAAKWTPTTKRSTSDLPVENWYVDAAVQGSGSHSSVVDSTCTPQYSYEAIVSIPLPSPSSPTRRHVADVVSALEIGVYHYQNNSDSSSKTKPVDERTFWRSACILGKARVDLSPLRYLPVVDGWHRITSESHAMETCLGYIRVCVRTL